jgi:diguanylate cyclase (GGDEF)-like protein
VDANIRGPKRHWPARLVWGALGIALLVQLVHYQFHPWPQLNGLLGGWLTTGFEVAAGVSCLLRAHRVREERRVWSLIGIAMLMWASADLIYTFIYADLKVLPVPTASDIVFLAAYPLIGLAIVLLTRERVQAPKGGLLVDGLLAALALATVSAAFLVEPMIDAGGGDAAAVAVTASYQAFDVVLLGMVVAVCALTGWRPGRSWLVLGGAILAITIGDSMYTLSLAATGYQGNVVDWTYSLGAVLFAVTPWLAAAPKREVTPTRWLSFVVPALFTGAALSVLIIDHFAPVPTVAIALAALTLLISIGRTVSGYGVAKALAQSLSDALADPLTRIGNRTYFAREMGRALATRRRTGAPVSVLFLDLNDFKAINDGLGHAVGDQCLQKVAERLTATLREFETCARLGGDEFGIVLERTGAAEAGVVAERVAAAVDAPMHLAGRELHSGAAIGIAVADDDSSIDALLHQADIAMYEAKERSSSYVVFSGTASADSDQLALATELRRGIERRELELYFQPQIDLRHDRVVSAEALVRWRHPERGLLPPGDFLNAADRSHQMAALSDEVLRLATEALVTWRQEGIELPVAVNLPGSVLLDRSLAQRIGSLLDSLGLNPDWLTIELTEDAIGVDLDQVESSLRELAELGFAISIDDFGQGHSSLNRLRRLPISELKVDRAFVAGMLDNKHDAAIVRSTINLAHELDLIVVAEGVEDEATLRQLKDLDCDLVQGYLIARPMPGDRIPGWVAEWQAAREARVNPPRPLSLAP